jgi:hypothetical protein
MGIVCLEFDSACCSRTHLHAELSFNARKASHCVRRCELVRKIMFNLESIVPFFLWQKVLDCTYWSQGDPQNPCAITTSAQILHAWTPTLTGDAPSKHPLIPLETLTSLQISTLTSA